MGNHGTTYRLAQFGKITAAFSEALAIVVEDMDPKAALSAVANKCEKLTIYIRLIFTALMTDQELVLVSRQEQELKLPLLEFVTTVAVAEVPEFDVGDHFRKDNPYGVKVASVGVNFNKIFGKKIERNVPAVSLRIHRLNRSANDPEIIVALGDKHSALLAWLWALVALQPNGPDSAPGVLSTYGTPTILEIPNDEGLLWSVYAGWGGVGWVFDAGSFVGPDGWVAGSQVVSR